jgi:hypothetical protein
MFFEQSPWTKSWTEGSIMNLIQLAEQAGLKPKFAAGTAGGEYHTSCPECGGKDRFYIQPNRQMKHCMGYYSCRQCDAHGDSIEFARTYLHCSFQEAIELTGATISDNAFTLTPAVASLPIILKAPPAEWIIKATEFARGAHERLLQRQELIPWFAQRGIPYEAIVRYKLGWIGKNLFVRRETWGLPQILDGNGASRLLSILSGIIIPIMETNGNVMRLKVRRSSWFEGDKLPKYMAISGSMNGLSIIGSSNRDVVVVVESELDAFALHHAVDDIACVIAVGSNIKNPDNVSDKIAQRAKHLIICHDNDEAGQKMLSKWKKMYSHAIAHPTPFGKDIGEAIQQGLDVRQWILEAINDPVR